MLICLVMPATPLRSMETDCDMPSSWACYESEDVKGVVLSWFPKVIPVVMIGIIVTEREDDNGTWDEGLMFYAFPYSIVISGREYNTGTGR